MSRKSSRKVEHGGSAGLDADELTCATVSLWPTAYRFKQGHRIRVQISSGAFPRYARSTGTEQARADLPACGSRVWLRAAADGPPGDDA